MLLKIYPPHSSHMISTGQSEQDTTSDPKSDFINRQVLVGGKWDLTGFAMPQADVGALS